MCTVWSVRFFLKFITEPIGIGIHIIGTDAHRLKSVFWPIACSFLWLVQSVWNIKITVYFFIKKIGLLGPVLSIKKKYISIHNMFKIPRKMYKLFTQTTNLFIHQPKYPLDRFFKRKKKKKPFQLHPMKHIVVVFSSSSSSSSSSSFLFFFYFYKFL